MAFHLTQRDKLIADPNSAEVARRIFKLAVSSKGVSEIARILNANGIPTPGQYFAANHPDSKKFSRVSNKMSWNHYTVRNILSKRVYTGAAVGHMRKTAAPLAPVMENS